ncbi:MAG: DUF4198 domain-containing protein, partial [Sphingobacteriales bacterium]
TIAPLLLISFVAATTDYFLLPENFFLHKGDKLSVRLFMGIFPATETGYQSPEAGEGKFVLYDGSKKIDIATQETDTVVAIKDYVTENSGLLLLHLSQAPVTHEVDKDEFETHLTEESQAELAKRVSKSRRAASLKEKYTRYMKTLVRVDKPSGNTYEKLIGDEYEIILKNNPYKVNYGDDITAVVYFKGKPLPEEQFYLYIKTATGNIHPQKLITDADGQVFFKLSREGIYMLRTAHTEAATNKDADFETWWASFSFAFSSANELPNTYKEFGFDVH